MGRPKRSWISQDVGSYHLISRVVGGEILLHDKEKEYFLNLLEKLGSSFFVKIHAFCIMGTHFHILATNLKKEAQGATKDELLARYRLIYGENAEPPVGAYDGTGNLHPDTDSGIRRLRVRLSSVSRFIQELKQTFSRWYNKNHNRQGCFWSERFKSVITEIGDAQLICSSYIDLNPIRANLVQKPEDYRWCSLGLATRNRKRWQKLITPLPVSKVLKPGKEDGAFVLFDFSKKHQQLKLDWYREFVYKSGGIPHSYKANLSPELIDSAVQHHGKLGLGDILCYRLKNISEGIAIGSSSIIAELQRRNNCKLICPRLLWKGKKFFVTRVLRC